MSTLPVNVQPTPSEFDGKKYLVYRGKEHRNMFFSLYSSTFDILPSLKARDSSC